ncbi:hypothetical protein MAR_006591 [Mya arenaria]|uniref:Uncharacterized protein n=1 Tax=Mya arenaria TaxID=6604 RepID=A0ABY7DCQ6_MYAAR|nr:hypothetical protein MAR_006591 [Mya arenaria]
MMSSSSTCHTSVMSQL